MRVLFTRAVLSLAVIAGVVAVPTLAKPAEPEEVSVFATGSLSTSVSPAGAILSVEAMGIGDERVGSVRIANTGSLAGDYLLRAETSGSELLARRLRVRIDRRLPGRPARTVYAGPLSALGSLPLGRFAPAGRAGAAVTFVFRVSLPASPSAARDNALQGLGCRVRLLWTANA